MKRQPIQKFINEKGEKSIMKTFEINGKEYNARPFDFNLMCDFEDKGIQLEEMSRKSRAVLRAYFALCAGIGLEEAGEELENHFIGGGDFSDIQEVFGKEMEMSSFFQSIIKRAEKENATVTESEEEEGDTQI